MSDDDDWITNRNSEARKNQPLVTEAVSVRIDQLLKGQLSERSLTSTEFTSVAKELIAGMDPAPPLAKAKP